MINATANLATRRARRLWDELTDPTRDEPLTRLTASLDRVDWTPRHASTFEPNDEPDDDYV